MSIVRLIRVSALVVVCFGIGLPGAGASARARRSSTHSQGGSPGTVKIAVKMVGDQLTFGPARVVIRRGQTVEWQNQSNQLHNVLDDAAKATNKADVGLPEGAAAFDSGFLKPGQNYTHRFTVRGTYRYVCTLHEIQGMKGEVVVK